MTAYAAVDAPMQLEPGPVAEWERVDFDLRVEPPEFEAAALAALGPLDAHLVEIERRELELAEAVELGQADELAEPVREATEALGMELELAAAEEMGEELAAAEEVDGLLIEAFEEMPDVAWQELPAPYTPPAEEGGFVGERPPGEIEPLPPGPIGTPLQPAPASPTVWIRNLTRPGATDFRVGEAWAIQVQGPGYASVQVVTWQDGVMQGPAGVGSTDASGRFDLQGWMSQYEVGYWVEQWTAGGQTCQPVLTFEVR